MRNNQGGNAVRRARAARTNAARNRVTRLYSALDKRRPVAPVAVAPAPVAVAATPVVHVTSVVERDGKHYPSCACGWEPVNGMTERGAKGQATRHRNSEQERAGNGPAAPVRVVEVRSVAPRRGQVAA